MRMADNNSDGVVPAALQCGICSQLCKRGVKVQMSFGHSWLIICDMYQLLLVLLIELIKLHYNDIPVDILTYRCHIDIMTYL